MNDLWSTEPGELNPFFSLSQMTSKGSHQYRITFYHLLCPRSPVGEDETTEHMTFYRLADEIDTVLVPQPPLLWRRTPYDMRGHPAYLETLSNQNCGKKTLVIGKRGEDPFLWLTYLSGSVAGTELDPSIHEWAGTEKESSLTREPHLWEQSGEGAQLVVRPSWSLPDSKAPAYS